MTQTATVTFDADYTLRDRHGNLTGDTLPAGAYTLEMPDDYNPALVTAEDVLSDYAIRVVRDDEDAHPQNRA